MPVLVSPRLTPRTDAYNNLGGKHLRDERETAGGERLDYRHREGKKR